MVAGKEAVNLTFEAMKTQFLADRTAIADEVEDMGPWLWLLSGADMNTYDAMEAQSNPVVLLEAVSPLDSRRQLVRLSIGELEAGSYRFEARGISPLSFLESTELQYKHKVRRSIDYVPN